MMNHKINLTLITLIFFAIFANASLLTTLQTDKNSLAENEIAFLTIKIYNDSIQETNNITLTLKGDEAIRFIEEKENITTAKQIEKMKAGERKEYQIKIKSVSSKKANANIYLYYGTTQPITTAAVTTIETKELPVLATITTEKKTINGEENLSIRFKLTNNSNGNITKTSAEIIPPKGFTIKTQSIFSELIPPGDSIEQKFEETAPFDSKGEQTTILAYGYYDDANKPHYFEKTFTMSFEKQNPQILIPVLIVILVIALYLFFKKDKTNEIKGTEKK
jgi:hypothetical protein